MNYEDVSKKLDEIETEMRKLGFNGPSNAGIQKVDSAFGGSEMAFEQWLALVFIPAARNAISTKELPGGSQVGVAAMRNFDGRDELDTLSTLLSEFDHIVEIVARQNTHKQSP